MVDHPCEKCGAAVEDGRPFCPQCRAPQIHVQIAMPDGGTAPTADTVDAATLPAVDVPDFLVRTATRHSLLDRGIAIRSSLKAGAVGVFLGLIPLLGVALTGALAVYFYRRESGSVPPPRVGSRLGAAAGLVSFTANALFTLVRIFAFHAHQQYVEEIAKIPQMMGYNPADPDVQTTIHMLTSPAGIAMSLLLGMIFAALLAAVGGALGAVVFRPSSRH